MFVMFTLSQPKKQAKEGPLRRFEKRDFALVGVIQKTSDFI